MKVAGKSRQSVRGPPDGPSYRRPRSTEHEDMFGVPAAGTQSAPPLPAHPGLVAHHRVVAQQLRYGRAVCQGVHLGRRARLQLGAASDHWRTGHRGRPVRTGRPAAAQQAHCDREDGALPPPAFPAERHWYSPMLRALHHPPQPLAGATTSEEEQKDGCEDEPDVQDGSAAPPCAERGEKPAITAGPASSHRAGRRSPRRCRRARPR